jgi:hypothetical protein
MIIPPSKTTSSLQSEFFSNLLEFLCALTVERKKHFLIGRSSERLRRFVLLEKQIEKAFAFFC